MFADDGALENARKAICAGCFLLDTPVQPADALPSCCGGLWRIRISFGSQADIEKILLPLGLHGCGTEMPFVRKVRRLYQTQAAYSAALREYGAALLDSQKLKNKGRMSLDSLPCSSFFLSVLYCFAGYFSLIEGNRNDCGNRPANRPGTPYPG